MRTTWLGAAALVALTVCKDAIAESGDTALEPTPARNGPRYWPTHDDGVPTAGAAIDQADRRRNALDRAFLYLIDPRLPAPLTALASYAPSYTSTGAAVRPLAANVSRSGLVNEFHLEVALLDRFAPFVTAYLASPLESEHDPRGAFNAGTRILLTPPTSERLRVAFDAAYLRDFATTSVAYSDVTATYDLQRVRFAGLVHAEHAFAPARDAFDLYVDFGTSVQVVDRLRLGAEYVVQEIEDAWSHDAEGGTRQFAGGVVAWSNDRVSLTAGPAFGFGGHAPSLLGRAVVSVAF